MTKRIDKIIIIVGVFQITTWPIVYCIFWFLVIYGRFECVKMWLRYYPEAVVHSTPLWASEMNQKVVAVSILRKKGVGYPQQVPVVAHVFIYK